MGGWNIDDVCVYGIKNAELDSEEVDGGGCACTSAADAKAPLASLFLIFLGALFRRKE